MQVNSTWVESRVRGFLPGFSIQPALSEEQQEALERAIREIRNGAQLLRQLVQDAVYESKPAAEVEQRISDLARYFQRESSAIIDRMSVGVNCRASAAITARIYHFEDDARAEPQRLQHQVKLAMLVRELHFDPRVAFSNTEFVDSLKESRIIYRISAFRNSTERGPDTNDIRYNRETREAEVMVEGNWMGAARFQALMRFDKKRDKFVTIGNEDEGWNYVSPHGFVRRDRVTFREIYPVAELTAREYERLLTHARTYCEGSPDPEKRYIVQVLTNQADTWCEMHVPEMWLTKNMLRNAPRHVSVRIITPLTGVESTAKVYSFGFQMDPLDSTFLREWVPFHLLGTLRGRFTTPDCEDAKRFVEKHVTSIPVTEEAAQRALQFVNQCNAEVTSFNFASRNCAINGANVLRQAGIDIDTSMPAGTFIWRMFPALKDIPLIGTPLHVLVQMVVSVAQQIITVVKACIPEPIKAVVTLVYDGMGTMIANIGVFIFGGSVAKQPTRRDRSAGDAAPITPLIQSPLDFLRERTCLVHNSFGMTEWQKAQKSTVRYTYGGQLNMCILP